MITLTNGVQVPENAVQLQTTAAIDGYYVTQPLRLVQYDETLPVAAVQLTYQNQPYTPPTGAELNVRMGKPDGTTVYNPCLGMDSSGIVYFVFTQQMTAAAGTGTLTVEITDSGVKNSAPITANVAENPVPEGSIESTDEFLTLQEILAEAEKWGQIVQTNASNIQQVVDNLTDIQNAAENAQAAAASAAAAQQAAQEALGFRKFYSAVVPDKNGNLDPSRPMTVGPAASVEIESAGDRIQSVTALGFTQQAGTGDPSPSNVRQLTNGGLKLVEKVITGAENWKATSITGLWQIANGAPGSVNFTAFCSDYQKGGSSWAGMPDKSVLNAGEIIGIKDTSYSSVSNFKSMLAARYAAGDPVTVWYQPADESQATGLYAPIILQGGEYRATCLPLTAPLCEGDKFISRTLSGCDKMVVLDGSDDENWQEGTRAGTWLWNSPYSDWTAANGLNCFSSYYPVVSYSSNVTGFSSPNGSDPAGRIIITDKSLDSSVEALRKHLAANPLKNWYKSTSYTETSDKLVSLETHQQAVLVLDGTENFQLRYGDNTFVWEANKAAKGDQTILCDHYKGVNTGWVSLQNNQIQMVTNGRYIGAKDTRFSTAAEFKAYLAAQYVAGTPVTIVYQLATPITYAHPAVVLEAATGDQLTYTVTGQRGGTVSVALKPFQDGGNAKTADNATNAVTAQTAANAQQLDGLTLAALQNLLVPVGYIFSWAPVDDGPDLSTPAKVAAYFGFGTWQAYGKGQVLVGVDSGQTEFNAVGQTGGEKTHTLTVQELASHGHSISAKSGGVVFTATGPAGGTGVSAATDWGPGLQADNTGGNQPHNNLQPYITVYRWQRVK